jgi:hypothetical protein
MNAQVNEAAPPCRLFFNLLTERTRLWPSRFSPFAHAFSRSVDDIPRYDAMNFTPGAKKEDLVDDKGIIIQPA